MHGPEREVFFEQEHVPGREAAVDFTDCTSLGVRIAGQVFAHLLFQFLLTFSRWRSVTLAFSETFEALVCGLQDAFWRLGGVPEVLRSDNLSAPEALVAQPHVDRLERHVDRKPLADHALPPRTTTTWRKSSASNPASTTTAAPPTSSRSDAFRAGTTLANTGPPGAGAAAFIHRYADEDATPIRSATTATLSPVARTSAINFARCSAVYCFRMPPCPTCR